MPSVPPHKRNYGMDFTMLVLRVVSYHSYNGIRGRFSNTREVRLKYKTEDN